MVTEKGLLTTSRLLVQKAIQSDSGLYTCTPSTANAATVRVHILSGKWRRHLVEGVCVGGRQSIIIAFISLLGEHPAAMHHGLSMKLSSPDLLIILFFSLAIHIYQSCRWRYPVGALSGSLRVLT